MVLVFWRCTRSAGRVRIETSTLMTISVLIPIVALSCGAGEIEIMRGILMLVAHRYTIYRDLICRELQVRE